MLVLLAIIALAPQHAHAEPSALQNALRHEVLSLAQSLVHARDEIVSERSGSTRATVVALRGEALLFDGAISAGVLAGVAKTSDQRGRNAISLVVGGHRSSGVSVGAGVFAGVGYQKHRSTTPAAAPLLSGAQPHRVFAAGLGAAYGEDRNPASVHSVEGRFAGVGLGLIENNPRQKSRRLQLVSWKTSRLRAIDRALRQANAAVVHLIKAERTTIAWKKTYHLRRAARIAHGLRRRLRR